MGDDSVRQKVFSFAKWLKSRMEECDYQYAAQLSKVSGVSPQSLSRLLDPKPLPDTGKYHLPRRDTVKKLARPLRVSVDEALVEAGYAPETTVAPSSALLASPFAALFYEAEGISDDQLRHDVDVAVNVLREMIRRKAEEARQRHFIEIPQIKLEEEGKK